MAPRISFESFVRSDSSSWIQSRARRGKNRNKVPGDESDLSWAFDCVCADLANYLNCTDFVLSGEYLKMHFVQQSSTRLNRSVSPRLGEGLWWIGEGSQWTLSNTTCLDLDELMHKKIKCGHSNERGP